MPRSTTEPEPLQAATTQPNTSLPRYTRSLGSPALGTAVAVHAAVADNAATQVVATAIANPDAPRNLTATPSGTTANVTAISITVTGTDIEDQPLVEVLPAFTAAAATAVTGVKVFKTVTSYSQPACGAAVSISLGLGSKLGLPRRMARNTVSAAFLNGVREATAPTVTSDGVNISGNSVTLNSALSGTPVIVDFTETLI